MRMRICKVNSGNDVTDRGFSMNVGGNSGSVTMPSSKVSTENTAKFIELIHQHLSVFDASCPEHKDAQRMRNVWQSIADIMGRDVDMLLALPASSKCCGPTSGVFFFFIFFLHIKLYIIAISIKSFCSISKCACCNTD